MFVGKLFVDELVIDMDFSRTALIVLVEIIYGHIFDKVKTHLMANMVVTRTQRICALCKYWNGAIGCTTIKSQVGAHSFQLDVSERQMCFKPGVGMIKSAQQTCQYFRPRYDD